MEDHQPGTWDEQCLESYRRNRERMRASWDRDLPFEELLFDRWERARTLGFGSGASIYHNAYVYGNVVVGERTWVGPYTLLDGSGGGIRIGKNCSISAGVHVYSHNTVRWALSGGVEQPERAPTEIGDCCYIGPYAIITMGVTIGAHCLVGTHSMVNRSVEPWSIVFGVPARVVGRVEIDEAGRVGFTYFQQPPGHR